MRYTGLRDAFWQACTTTLVRQFVLASGRFWLQSGHENSVITSMKLVSVVKSGETTAPAWSQS